MDSSITQFLMQFGILAIFLIILLEYACFPISSELVLPISGMITAQMGYPIVLIILLSVLAGVLGSSICYFLGRWGGIKVMERLLRRFPKMAEKFNRTCLWQREYGKATVMLGRVIPIFRTYISFAAGITKQNYLVFAVFSSIGILSWNTLLLSCGYLLGENFSALLPFVKQYAMVIASLVLLVFIVISLFKKSRKKCLKD